MTAIPSIDPSLIRHWLTRELLILVGRIACIVFTIEIIIMLMLSGWNITGQVIAEGLFDATTLTLTSSPLIYLWVARPFADAARKARMELTQQLAQTQGLLDLNEKLRKALQAASEHAAETNEQVLQKIGAELHDGPAQLLSFTLLKLDRLGTMTQPGNEQKSSADLEKLRDVVTQTLREVREISTGLSLPELGCASIEETIRLAVRRHEEFTGAKVAVALTTLPGTVSLAQKVCIYRLIQEALSNTFKHAQAKTTRVTARGGHELTIAVSDDGQGFDPSAARGRGLGLFGMRSRVQALSGRFEVESAPGHGTTLTATFGSTS